MAKKRKKVNPRRVPVSLADLKRTGSKAADEAIHLSFALFLTVLLDYFNFNTEQLQLAWDKADKLSQEVNEGRINLNDLVSVLEDEYHVILRR